MAFLPWRKGEAPQKGDGKYGAPHAITAAAIPLEGPNKVRVGRSFKAGQSDWQKEALYYYDAVGEFRGAVTWIANAVSKAELHAAEIDPETGTVGEPTDDTRVQAVAQQVLGGMDRRAQSLQTLAVLWQVPGEAFVIVRPTAAGQPDEWLVLSARKVTYKGDTWTYMDPATLETVALGARDLLMRVWAPHPDDPFQSDSAARPALPILREIEKASQNIAARLDSRLAGNGVWLFPSEASFPTPDGMSKAESVMDYFLTAAEASLRNPGQASAQVPIVVEVPGEQIAAATAGFLDFSTAFDAAVVELRASAIERLAQTLDMPNETAEGSTGGMNHWGAWQVEESTYKIYIEPLLDRLGDAITSQYFRPALQAMGVADPERYILAWDTTSIVSRPERGSELRELHDRVLISDDYLRAEAGIPDDAVPSDEEKRRRELLNLVGVAPTLLSDPRIGQELFGFEVAPAAVGVDPATAELPAGEEAPSNALPAGAPQQRPDENVPDGLVAAAEFAVYDALSRAGKRLLTREHRAQFGAYKAEELYLHIPHSKAAHELLEGSFAFIDGVADAYGMQRPELEKALLTYSKYLLATREQHDRDLLRRTVREALR